MFRKFLARFSKIVAVEVERPRPPLASDDEIREAVLSLQHHPGFQHLCNKLRWQRHMLETQLRNTRHASITDVEFLQSGIAWSRWLDDQIASEIKFQGRRVATELTAPERDALAAVKSAYEEIG